MEAISAFFMSMVDHVGYAGVFVVMMLGSMCIPIGSEIILPGAGALVASGHLPSVVVLGVIATLGEIVGCSVLYAIGYFGGRPFILRFAPARVIHELERLDAFYARFGNLTVLLCRFVPVLRGASSLPAGVSRMHVMQFLIYTLVGSALWCFALAYLGLTLGKNIDSIAPHFHRITFVVLIAVVVAIAAAVVWQRSRLRSAA